MDPSATIQVIPGQKQTETALDNLVGQGILGSVCVILIVALVWAVRSLLKAKDDRFNDQKLMVETLAKHNDAAKELAIEMNKSASNLLVEQTKSLDVFKNALSSQERSFGDLSRVVSSAQQESINLRMLASHFRGNGG